MATVDVSGGERATGAEVAVALADVLQQMMEDAARQQVRQALRLQEQEAERRLQEALRLQEQEAERRLQEALHLQQQEAERRLQEALRVQEQVAERRLQEALRQHEQQLQERDDAIRTFLEEGMQRVEARVAAVEERGGSSGERSEVAGGQGALEQQLQERDEAIRCSVEERMLRVEARMAAVEGRGRSSREESDEAGGQEALQLLEVRMGALEEALQRALAEVFPRVEALVAQLEERFPTRAPCVPPSSPATAAHPSTSTASQPFAASALGARAPGGSAAVDEESERQRVMGRIQEALARRERAHASSSLGEELCAAAYEGRLEDVRRLLDSGADVNYTNALGWSPLMSTFYNGVFFKTGHPDVVSLLLQRGADVGAVEECGQTALHFAAWNDTSGRCVALLLGAGADVDARDWDGQTPLHWAASWNNEAAVRALLAAGARKDLIAWVGLSKDKTPFDSAQTIAIKELLRP